MKKIIHFVHIRAAPERVYRALGICRSLLRMTGAAASWVLHGDPAREWISPLVLAALAIASWMLRPPTRVLGTIFTAERLP